MRTTNLIESTFATIRYRIKITKGSGSLAAGLAMAFELIEAPSCRAGGQCTAARRPHPSLSVVQSRPALRTTAEIAKRKSPKGLPPEV